MSQPDLTVTVGPDPDAPDDPVQLSHDALDAGCYVAGDDPQRRTALLHDWCVQWAERGHGFWYVHPRGPAPRELLGRLPAGRLDDVVWIDFTRRQLADSLDVPPIRRVGVDPVAGPAAAIDTAALATPPAVGRSAGWLAAASEATARFDWNVARVLDTLIPLLVDEAGPAIHEIPPRCRRAALEDDPGHVVELVDEPAIERQLTQAHAHDDAVFRRVAHCLSLPRDPFASNPLLGASTYAVEAALTSTDIVLVTGALPAPDTTSVATPDLLGTHVLIQTLVRRLWEAAQTAPPDARPTPLLLDGVTALSPAQDTLLPELIAHAPATPLAPVLAGPERDALPDRLTLPITDGIDTRVQYTDGTRPGHDALPTGDTGATAQAIEREQSSPVAAGECWWLSTGNAGLLTGDPRTATPTRAVRRGDPPATRHDAATVAQAITDSVTRHGTVPEWLTDELIQEVREQ